MDTTKDINEKLSGETLTLSILGMETAPDQSPMNELIRRFDSDSINKLRDIHDNLFIQRSNSVSSHARVVVDFNQTGLIANGKNFELDKGYFSKKKNQS